jgi:hypothetical protein
MQHRRLSALAHAVLPAALAVGALASTPLSHQQAPATPPAAPTVSGAVLEVQGRDGAWRRLAAAPAEFEQLADLGGAIAMRLGATSVGERGDGVERAQVELALDDAVLGRVAGAQGETLELELLGGARLSVSIDDVRRIVFAGRLGGASAAEAPPSGDRLYWVRPKGLDRVDGSFQEFSSEGIVFESALGVRTFPWSEVGALTIEPLGAAPVRERGARSVSVDLAGGGRLHGDLLGVRDGSLRLNWRGRTPLALPLEALAQVVLDDGSVAHLSGMKPALAVEGWPENDDTGMRWPYQLDRSVMGETLRSGGRAWPRGIGVHSPSRLEWELDGTWKALHGAAAIDDSVKLLAYRGSVRCAIYLDGAEAPAWSSGRLEGGAAPVEFSGLALEGVRRVALVVEMDERLYVADRLNWLDLRLVK